MSETIMDGTRVRISVAFTLRTTGAAADPTTATLRISPPSGTRVDVPLTKDAVGLYHSDYTVDAAGVWEFEALGTGAVVATTPKTRIVVRAGIPAPA